MSSESPEQNYRGFINVAVLILLVNNIRYIVENLKQYGWMFNIVPSPKLVISHYENYPFIFIFAHLGIYVLITFLIQKIYL